MENNKTRREAALLVVVVFLLGALVGGIGTRLWSAHAQEVLYKPGVLRPRAQVISEFTQELQLTREQQQQLGTIVDDTRARWRALYAPLDVQHEQIRQDGRNRIRAILTPEQKPKFEEFMRRIDAQREKEKEQSR
jgi:Spy/CpxP family protein refolding chaperone